MKMGDKAVSEIIGAVLLLAIAVSIFSVIYMNVLSDKGPSADTFVTIIGKLEQKGNIPKTVAFENKLGENLGPDTDIILEIYGQRNSTKIRELASIYPFLQDGWNIGEKIYPAIDKGDLTGTQIDAYIVDKISNSMVFWGTLQKGPKAPFHGRGGIWHFDEPLGWDDNKDTKEVLDSSGNENHGTAVNGANNTNRTSVIGKAGFFDGIDDFVEVSPSYSLNITKALTVEAWLRPLEERTEIDTKDFGQAFAYNPEILKVKDDLYVIVGEAQAVQSGMVVTVKITSDGLVSEPLDESFFNETWGLQPSLIEISSNDTCAVYAIAYKSFKIGILQTMKINFSDGKITSQIDHWDFDIIEANLPYIIKVSDNVFAIAYRDTNNKGLIKTIQIDDDGFIINKNTAPIANYTFNDTAAYGPSIIKVSNYIYTIVYKNSNNLGLIQTINITLDGHIYTTGNPIEEVYFGKVSSANEANPNQEQRIKIIYVTGEYYAIIYSDDKNIGNIITVRIRSTGDISKEDGHIFPFTADYCMAPDIIQVSNNTYAITYAQKDNLGSLVTIQIRSDGSIDSLQKLSSDVSSGLKFFSPEIIHISNRVFAIVYMSGTPHEGMLTTILTEDYTPIYQRGVVRAGAASVYAQWRKDASVVNLLACINTSADSGEIITANISTNIWHHIVLTFDGSKMCLYNDAFLIDCKSVGPSIYIPKTTLRFGNSFYGYLDEIAIFDHALTQPEIENRFNSVINTEINHITSPVMSSPITITATATGPILDDITLWYRWRNEIIDPVDINTCNYDSNADKGTETNFANAKSISTDGNVMTIQESAYGIPAVDESHYVNGFTNYINDWTCTAGGSPWLNAIGDGKTISTKKDGNDIGWLTFTNTTADGSSSFTISLYVYATAGDGNDDITVYIDTTGDNIPEFTSFIENPASGWFNTGAISGLTTVDDFNAARVWLEYKGETAPYNYITLDAAYLRITSIYVPDCYNIDFEYQWTAANYNAANAELCIYVDSHTGLENLLVNYWTGSVWSPLGTITSTGWSNFTATGLVSSTYIIQLTGAKESGDTYQDSWNIDALMLHTWDNYDGPNGHQWIKWNDASNPDNDNSDGWTWNFNFPDGIGHYEFYSIGKSGSIIEPTPLSADTICLYI